MNIYAQGSIDVKATKKETYKDTRDSKTYITVTIGTQTWMAQNMDYKTQEGKSLSYDENKANQEKYGLLYNHKAALAACPSGWHLPSKDEWMVLVDFLGGDDAAPVKLKTTKDWEETDPDLGEEPADNSSGFSALPGGFGNFLIKYSFFSLGENAFFWSSTTNLEDKAGVFSLAYDSRFSDYNDESASSFYSVRCLKD